MCSEQKKYYVQCAKKKYMCSVEEKKILCSVEEKKIMCSVLVSFVSRSVPLGGQLEKENGRGLAEVQGSSVHLVFKGTVSR